MTLLVWYLGCFGFGALAGSHSGFWGGLGLLVIGIPVYFMTPHRFRQVVTERHMVIGAVITFGMAASFYPLMMALGIVGAG